MKLDRSSGVGRISHHLEKDHTLLIERKRGTERKGASLAYGP